MNKNPTNEPEITREEIRDVAAEAKHGKRTRFFEQSMSGKMKPVFENKLRDEMQTVLGKDEQDRNRKLREQVADWRKAAHRVSIALLNKEALEDTVQGWQDRYDEICEQLKHVQGLLQTFQGELGNQRSTMVDALQAKVKHGATAKTVVADPTQDPNSCLR